MREPAPSIDENLLRQVERWGPLDAEVWAAWRDSLSPAQRADSMTLQAVLSGVVALGRIDDAGESPGKDFRPRIRVIRSACLWALELAAALPVGEQASPEPPRSEDRPADEPAESLRTLERVLTEGVVRSERLLDKPSADSASARTSLASFLEGLSQNRFFRPPEPLEFCDVAQLVSPALVSSELAPWRNEATKTMLLISFLSLLRSHRFLGIADRQIREHGDLDRAHAVIAGVRRELRSWTRFVLIQGVETFADELEARLLELDADHMGRSRSELASSSRQLQRLRASLELTAADVHAKACAALAQPLPRLGRGGALEAERLRSGIVTVRRALKDAAKSLHGLRSPERATRSHRRSDAVTSRLQPEMWAFRLILRAFIAKASAAPVAADDWRSSEDFSFVDEFVRHFRVFAPRLIEATGYARRTPLVAAVSALRGADASDLVALELARSECERFAEHLDARLGEMPESPLAPFDKRKAATELRGYLVAAKERRAAERASAGAFGSLDARPARAG